MILIDSALAKLEKSGKPIRVGMVGAGFMAKGVVLEIEKYTKGMKLVAISNRHPEKAKEIYETAGVSNSGLISTVEELEIRIDNGEYSYTDNADLLCRAKNIDAILEVTGAIEFGAKVALMALKNKKHVILMNAELDGTIGPILKKYADENGVVLTNVDGDQPGVIMNLYRFVKKIGLKPVLCGNIKGLHDPYRNPTTQEAFAKQWGQKAHMVTSFADGSKISFENTIVANGTGMRVAKRGMHGPTVDSGTPITDAVKWYPLEDLLEGPGIVDYVVGAVPGPGVYVLGTTEDPIQKHYLNLYKLGEGPLYCFYTPYHLCHFEVPNTIARAVIFDDAALTPMRNKPFVEVITVAKIDLKKGDKLDGIGFYMTYGLCENTETARKENLLPIGLSEDCVLTRDIKKDEVLTFDDVTLPEGRLCDELWREQFELL